MPLSANRTDFTFNHADQVDEYGAAEGDFTVVQANFDSRAEQNLTDINNIKDYIRTDLATKTDLLDIEVGILPEVSVTDIYLSDAAGDIKTRFITHTDDTAFGEVHGVRVNEETFQYYNGSEWVDVGGIDYSKYTPYYYDSSITLAANNVYEPIVNRTGEKGYLALAVARSNTAADIVKIKVTVDGVVMLAANDGTTANISVGLASSDMVSIDTGVKVLAGGGVSGGMTLVAPYKQLPYNDDTQVASVIVPQHIFYNTSIKVEVATSVNTNAVIYVIAGGAKA